ncbi:MAG: hypothetical protein JWP44_5041 [Mucilaginibacter sp.]|nr:hypothetical protein [Mucilaginibacter sp.]
MSVSAIKVDKKSIIERAKEEVQDEFNNKAVAKFKAKLRELESARTIVANIERELADMELAFDHGNI